MRKNLFLAAVLVTQLPATHTLRHGDQVLGEYESHEACVAAIPEPTVPGILSYTCGSVTVINIEGTCDPLPKPAFEARLDHYQCPATAEQSYALIEVYDLEREAFPGCRWREVGRRLLNCNDPIIPAY